MVTQCYSMVRGSVVRVTALDRRGRLGDDAIRFAVSKCVARVTINEVTESGSNEILRNDESKRRLHIVRAAQTVRYTVGVEFVRTDPGLLSLVAGVPLVTNAVGDIVGFDANTKIPATSFALEVWSNLSGAHCEDGTRQWGYTLFPFLRGGLISGFSFANAAVKFNLQGAQTRRMSKWGFGPYDLNGSFQRLVDPVSGNTNWKQALVSGTPPEPTDGIVEFQDVIEGGTATVTSSDVLDGQFVVTSSSVVDGGPA